MGLVALVNHVINFLAPALWLALLLPVLTRVFLVKGRTTRPLLVQVAMQLVIGVLTLTIGLVALGSDGKMLTYAALVLSCASGQFLLLRR